MELADARRDVVSSHQTVGRCDRCRAGVLVDEVIEVGVGNFRNEQAVGVEQILVKECRRVALKVDPRELQFGWRVDERSDGRNVCKERLIVCRVRLNGHVKRLLRLIAVRVDDGDRDCC